MSKVEKIAEAHRVRSDLLYIRKLPPRGDVLSFRMKGRKMPKGFSVGIIGFMVRRYKVQA